MSIRTCEQCGYDTTGALRPTKRIDGAVVLACEDCALEVEHAKDCEPSDADGEDFRGNEREAFDREQQADAQRVK